ncbi:MAG: hypothetical protein ACK4VI_05250 [Alphaproteobacteria bacterium]
MPRLTNSITSFNSHVTHAQSSKFGFLIIPIATALFVFPCGNANAQDNAFDSGLNYLTIQQQQQAAQAQERALQNTNDPFRPFEGLSDSALSPTGRAVPARELNALPDALSIGDQRATIRVQDGRIISETQHELNNAETEFETGTNVQPQTLDAQIQGRNIQPDSPDSSGNKTAAKPPLAPQNSNVDIGRAAVVDRSQGAKINIISNTDTGVKLGQ